MERASVYYRVPLEGTDGSPAAARTTSPWKVATLVLGVGGCLCLGLVASSLGPSPLMGAPDAARGTSLGALLPDCGVPAEFCMEPPAKQTVRKMDGVLIAQNGMLNWPQFKAIMTPFWAENFSYVTGAFPPSRGLSEWYHREYLSYNAHFPRSVFTQMIFLGENRTASTTTYARVKWTGSFRGIDEPGTPVVLRILDFYIMDERGQISYNYMIIDWADVFRQLGRRVLPPAALPEGLVLPPAAMYGVPAPASQFADPAAAEASREVVRRILREDLVEQSEECSSWHPGLTWYGPGGFGLARGVDEYREHFVAPMRRSLGKPSIELKVLTCEDHFCGAHGWLSGDHQGDLLGLNATGKRLHLRFGMHWRVQDGRAVEGWAIFDIPDLFQQLGMDLFEVAASQTPGALLAQPPKLKGSWKHGVTP